MGSRTLFISTIRWSFVWQRHQALASLFAEDGDVVFCELPGVRHAGMRDLSRAWLRLRERRRAVELPNPLPRGVTLARPRVVPATNAIFGTLNERAVARYVARHARLFEDIDVIVDYSPTALARSVIARVPHRRLIYDCTDDWLAVRGISRQLDEDERRLLRQADLTLVPSRELEQRKGADARRLERVPHGAFVERFLVPERPAPDLSAVSLMYYGHLHAQHLDFVALTALANARPGWRIVLVGPVKTPHRFPSNVELAGQAPHEQLREHVARADVLLLPYRLNDYTRAVMPAKTYECLATGRPIVATPLPELVSDFSAYFHFAREPAEWSAAVERALGRHSAERAAAQIACARQNTWADRYRRIRALLASA